jgi:hypothetical protein
MEPEYEHVCDDECRYLIGAVLDLEGDYATFHHYYDDQEKEDDRDDRHSAARRRSTG